MTRRNQIFVFIAVLILFIGGAIALSPKADAHVSWCTVSAYSPKLIGGDRLLRGSTRWHCGEDRHHAYQRVEVVVQYKVARRMRPDYWAGIPPSNATETTNMSSSTYTTVRCANGEKEYRTKVYFDMYGDQGMRRVEAKSGVTTKSC